VASADAGATAVALATTASGPGHALELDGTIEARWKMTMTAVNGRKRMLGAFLEESRLLGVAGGAIVLAMDDLHRAVIDAGEHRAIVREELVKVFGQALDLKCTTLAPGQAPRPPVVDDVKPLIDRAIEFFDGEILDRGGRGDRST
jgi:hypothetical protein